MKSVKTLLILGSSLGVMLLATGCSKTNVPCDTDPSMIEGARAELQSSQDGLESARSELATARQRKDQVASQLNNLPDPADLEARLHTLKKGSGR